MQDDGANKSKHMSTSLCNEKNVPILSQSSL